jgi:hypothetical protein
MPKKRSSLYSPHAAWSSGETWSNERKPWDYRQPFHRIHSPYYDEKRGILDGLGCKCGCHSRADYVPGLLDTLFKTITDQLGIPTSVEDLEKEIDKAIPGTDAVSMQAKAALKKALKDARDAAGIPKDFDLSKWLGGLLENGIFAHLVRRLPAWAPVERGKDEVKEIEGVLWNSFLDHRSFPYAQWHRWYDWNFHVVPFRGYQYLQSKGNDLYGTAKDAEWSIDVPFGMPSYCEWPMECKWDAGALGGKLNDPGTYVPPMLAPSSGILGAAHDWLWPQPGQYVWLAGRWVYNCQEATTDDENGLMRSELHPCSAIATARWEAVAFPENARPVPAIQFLFFQNLTGSYVDVPGGGKPYEFIVDLPPAAPEKVTYPIGSTHPVDSDEKFMLNTLVVRPRLLVHYDVAPFASVGNEAKLSNPPKVELAKPFQDEKGLYQAKVTIDPGSAKVYGIVVSLGWHDPGGTFAAGVRRVRVKFDSLVKHSIDHDTDAEEWRLNVGVNGRWFQFRNESMHNDSDPPLPLGAELVLHLHEDDYLTICAHGTEGDGEDEYIRRPMLDRELNHLHVDWVDIPGGDKLPDPWNKLKIPTNIKLAPATWADIDPRKAGETKSSPDEKEKISALARDFLHQGIVLADRHNDMLGRIAPGDTKSREPNRVGDAANQVKLKDLLAEIGEGNAVQKIVTAYEWADLRDSAEAQFHLNSTKGREAIRDYTLHYTVTIEKST